MYLLINKWNLFISWRIFESVQEFYLETYKHTKAINFKFLFEMTKKNSRKKKKKKRIINAYYRYYNLIIRRSLACAITHTIIVICSRYTQRAFSPCSLFKIFLPSFSIAIAVFWSLKEKREKEQKKRNLCANYSNLLWMNA